MTDIFPYPSHKTGIPACCKQRHRVALTLGLVLEFDERSLGKDLPGILKRKVPCKLGMDGHGVRLHDGDTDARRADGERIRVEHLSCFVVSLHFFLGVAVLQEGVYVRNHVKRDRVGKYLGRQGFRVLATAKGEHLVP